MPFTASHPAAVLPLVRRGRWVTAGLLTGSVAPDLPSFLPLGLTHDQTHPPKAILWPDSLLAIGLLVAWWVLLRPGLAPLWPGAAARCGRPGWRDSRLRPGRIRRDPWPAAGWLGWLALSELVGLATHLGWDAFTHSDGYVARRWSPLQGSVAGHLTVDWLQGLSSVVGLAVVVGWLLVEWRRAPAPTAALEPIGLRLRLGVAVAVLVATLVAGADEWHRLSSEPAGHLQVWSQTAKVAGGALLVGLGVWSLVWAGLRAHRRAVADPHSPTPAGVP